MEINTLSEKISGEDHQSENFNSVNFCSSSGKANKKFKQKSIESFLKNDRKEVNLEANFSFQLGDLKYESKMFQNNVKHETSFVLRNKYFNFLFKADESYMNLLSKHVPQIPIISEISKYDRSFHFVNFFRSMLLDVSKYADDISLRFFFIKEDSLYHNGHLTLSHKKASSLNQKRKSTKIQPITKMKFNTSVFTKITKTEKNGNQNNAKNANKLKKKHPYLDKFNVHEDYLGCLFDKIKDEKDVDELEESEVLSSQPSSLEDLLVFIIKIESKNKELLKDSFVIVLFQNLPYFSNFGSFLDQNLLFYEEKNQKKNISFFASEKKGKKMINIENNNNNNNNEIIQKEEGNQKNKNYYFEEENKALIFEKVKFKKRVRENYENYGMRINIFSMEPISEEEMSFILQKQKNSIQIFINILSFLPPKEIFMSVSLVNKKLLYAFFDFPSLKKRNSSNINFYYPSGLFHSFFYQILHKVHIKEVLLDKDGNQVDPISLALNQFMNDFEIKKNELAQKREKKKNNVLNSNITNNNIPTNSVNPKLNEEPNNIINTFSQNFSSSSTATTTSSRPVIGELKPDEEKLFFSMYYEFIQTLRIKFKNDYIKKKNKKKNSKSKKNKLK